MAAYPIMKTAVFISRKLLIVARARIVPPKPKILSIK